MNRNSSTTAIKGVAIPKIWLWSSALASLLVSATSLLGILFDGTYSRDTKAWAVQAVGQDYANLVVVMLLLASTYYLSRGSLKAYLVWLGAHLYIIYVFAIYAFAVHFNFLFLIYILILGISFYTLIGGLRAVDTANLSATLITNTTSKKASALLMFTGIMFSALWLAQIVPYLQSNQIPPILAEIGLLTNPVHVLDLAFMLPGMIIASVLIWRRDALGFLVIVPLLVFSATVGLGIISMFVLSASMGSSGAFPAGLVVGFIVFLSVYFVYLFLREVNDPLQS
jgi:hypothetical protein